MADLKKADDDKWNEVCSRMRQDGPFVEAGENDNLIVQRLEVRCERGRHLRLFVPLRERRQAEGRQDRRRRPDLRHDRRWLVSGLASALLLREERSSRRHPRHERVPRRVRLRGRTRCRRLPRRSAASPRSPTRSVPKSRRLLPKARSSAPKPLRVQPPGSGRLHPCRISACWGSRWLGICWPFWCLLRLSSRSLGAARGRNKQTRGSREVALPADLSRAERRHLDRRSGIRVPVFCGCCSRTASSTRWCWAAIPAPTR